MNSASVHNSLSTRMGADQQRRGMRLAYCGQAVGVVLVQLLVNSAFGILLVKHLGGSDVQAMMLVTFYMLSRILQIPVSILVPPWIGKRFMLWCFSINGLMIMAGLAVTFFPIEGMPKVKIFLLLIALGFAVQMSGYTFWFPLLHDVVPDSQRGRFFGKMRAIWSSSTFVAVVLIGLFMGESPPIWKFQVVLAVGLVLYFARNIFLIRLPEGRSVTANTDYADWKSYVKQILSSREVLIFCGYYSLLMFCAGFLGTPLVLYMKEKGFPVCENMIIFGFTTLGSVLSLFLAGELTDRIGTKRVFLIAHLVLCAVSLGVVKIGGMPKHQAEYLMPIAMILSGGMIAMSGVACSAQMFHLAPDRGRAFFMSLSMVVMTVGFGFSPLLAGYIFQTVPDNWVMVIQGVSLDIFQTMLFAAGMSMLVLISLLVFVEDVRPRSVPST